MQDKDPSASGDNPLDALDVQAPRNSRALAPRDKQLAYNLAMEGGDAGDADEIDLLAYWRILVKRRWLIVGIVAAVVAIALVRTLLTPSMFRATAVLEINRHGVQVMQQGIQPARGYDPDFAQTQYQLLQSRDLAQRVAEDMHLAGSGIFERLQPPSWWDRLRSLWAPSDRVGGAGGARAAPVGDAAGGPDPTGEATDPPADAAGQLRAVTGLVQGGLSVEPIRNTHLVRIHYVSTLPKFSARVANAVAEGFIAASMDRQVGASSYASKYLKDKLEELRSRLEHSERTLVQFAQEAKIVPNKDNTSLAAQNLADLNQSLATAQADRIQAQALWQQVEQADGTSLPASLTENGVLQQLEKNLTDLQSQYQEQLETFKPEYPTMQALQGRIDTVKHQISSQSASIRASVKAQYDAAETREKMLISKLADLRTAALEVDSRSIRYKILKRDVDTNRQLYNALLQRYKQVSVASGIRPSNISIIDRAVVPGGRYSPSLSRNLSLGLLLGLFLAIGTALLLEYLDNTLKAPDDIERLLGIGVLGIIPKVRKETPSEAFRDVRSALSESYRSARTALQFSTEQGVPASLLITSAKEGEGKSTSALLLARCFAQLGQRVLLIEADMRNPKLADTLGLPMRAGLSNLLSGGVSMAQATTQTEEDNLDVLLAGPLPPNPSELLSGRKLASLLLAGTNKYDQVIIDGPPVLGIADAPLLANATAGTLMVVQSGGSRIDAAQAAVKRLQFARGHLVGALLTQYNVHASGYAYSGCYAYQAGTQLE